MIVRNDDVNFDTNLQELEIFCNICDRHGFKIMQCITPVGAVEPIDSRMSNEQIREVAGDHKFNENKEVMEYLLGRDDIIALHGYYHEHRPALDDISRGKRLLLEWGLNPTYYVPPFNETTVDYDVFGMKTSAMTQRLEDYQPGMGKWGEVPTDEIVYCHSWRWFRKNWYRIEALDITLGRIADAGR